MSKVLIVEDEVELRQSYKRILESKGHITEVAGDGKEALDKVYKFKPKVILLDIKMPNMNGIEFLDNLDRGKSKATVVIFSNLDNDKDIRSAREAGAQRYILKSWASPNELVKLVEDAAKN